MTYPRWYAVHTRPQCEAQADQELRRLGYWTFYPFQRERRRRKRPNCNIYSIEWVEKPYFSRYLFVALRDPTESLYGVNEANSVSTVVYCGGEPLEIPHAVMDELMNRTDDKGLVGSVDLTARKQYNPGQRVKFTDNHPLSGLVAQVIVDARRHVRVWVELLGSRREVSVAPRAIAEIA